MKVLKITTIAAFMVIFSTSCDDKKTSTKDQVENMTEQVEQNTEETLNEIEGEVDETLNQKTTPFADHKEISVDTYEGDDKKVVATYMGNDTGKMSVKIDFDGQTIYLPQKEAWAKGAVYSNDSIEFTNKGQIDEAELKIDDNVYKMKLVK